MPVEIERKFRVISDDWRVLADAGCRLRQAYIAHDAYGSVRVRLTRDALAGDRAWLTLKGARTGMVRDEFEYQIPVTDAEEMLDRLCSGPVIEKVRYRVPHDGKIWEVDVFAGAVEGLILAEVEMRAVDERFDLPDWVGDEVTDDPRFRNSAVALMLSIDAAA